MVDCNQLKKNPGVARKILAEQGAGALNKAMQDCGEVRKQHSVVKMDGEFEKHLNAALGWDGAAAYLAKHNADELNAELQRRGISHRVRVDSQAGGQQKSSPAAPAFDPVFPGMQVPADNSQPDTTGQRKAYQEKHKRAGTDPLFGAMDVPKK